MKEKLVECFGEYMFVDFICYEKSSLISAFLTFYYFKINDNNDTTSDIYYHFLSTYHVLGPISSIK